MNRRFGRISIALAAAALAMTVVPASVSAGTVDSIWGWAVVRKPTLASYMLAAKDAANSAGGTNTFLRVEPGHYGVTFNGLQTAPCSLNGSCGHGEVTPLGTTLHYCWVEDFSTGSPLSIEIKCRDRHGVMADTPFSLNFLAPRDNHGTLAYFYANDPTASSYTPVAHLNYNSTNEPNWVERNSTGVWFANTTNINMGDNGNLQVHGRDGLCRIHSRGNNDDPGDVYGYAQIECFDYAGDPADMPWVFSYTRDVGLTGVPDHTAAFVLADNQFAASYTPTAAYNFSTAGKLNTVTRSSTGAYTVKLRGMPLGGSAQVTSFGGSATRFCQISAIQKKTSPQKVGVRCFKPDGSPTDSQFFLTYTR
jgi:hypothetical protein